MRCEGWSDMVHFLGGGGAALCVKCSPLIDFLPLLFNFFFFFYRDTCKQTITEVGG